MKINVKIFAFYAATWFEEATFFKSTAIDFYGFTARGSGCRPSEKYHKSACQLRKTRVPSEGKRRFVFVVISDSKMSIETIQPTENKPVQESRDTKKEDDKSGDEYERKDQDPPLEIGEHYLVKRGEDSWRKHLALSKLAPLGPNAMF